MRKTELERLMADLRHDEALRSELERLEHPQRAVALVEAKGYRLSPDEAKELVRSLQGLSDDELDKAAGGAWNDPPPTGPTGG